MNKDNNLQPTTEKLQSTELEEKLIELKAWFFGCSFYSIANWIAFCKVELPDYITEDMLEHWEPEKSEWLAKDKINLQGVAEDYRKRLRDRLDVASALKEKIVTIYHGMETSKDINQATLALKKIAEIEDEVATLLKVSSFRSKVYEENKSATTDILVESKYNRVKI